MKTHVYAAKAGIEPTGCLKRYLIAIECEPFCVTSVYHAHSSLMSHDASWGY